MTRRNRSVESSNGWDQTACKPGSVPPAFADAAIIPLDRPLLDGSRDLPGRLGPARPCPGSLRGASSLFGLAPGGACHAASVAGDAVRSYRTLSPLPGAEAPGGLLSVALSLGSPPAGVTRRLFAVEPGLSSIPLAGNSDRPAVWSAAKVGARGAGVKFSAGGEATPSAAIGSPHRRRRALRPVANAAGKR